MTLHPVEVHVPAGRHLELDGEETNAELARRLVEQANCRSDSKSLAERICDVLREMSQYEPLEGMEVPGALASILIDVFREERGPALLDIVAHDAARETIRIEALAALGYLAAEGSLDLTWTRRALAAIDVERWKIKAPVLAICWTMCVAFLGDGSLRARARQLFADPNDIGEQIGLRCFDYDTTRIDAGMTAVDGFREAGIESSQPPGFIGSLIVEG